MKNRAWTWKIVGAGVLLLLVWAMLQIVAGARRLERVKAALAAKGETLDWREIEPPNHGAANGRLEFLDAINGLTRPPRALLADRFTSPGRKIPLSQYAFLPTQITESYATGSSSRRWITNVWDEIEHVVAWGAENWRLARAAATNEVIALHLNWDKGPDLLLPHLARQKYLFEWMHAATIHDLHLSDPDAALEKVITGFRLLEIYQEPCLISALVRLACATYANRAVWELTLRDHWTDAQLARLQKAVGSVRFVESFDRALQMERVLGVKGWESMFRDPDIFRKYAGRGHVTTMEEQLLAVTGPLWRTFVGNVDLAWYLENSQRQLELARASGRARSLTAHTAAFAGAASRPPKHYLFSQLFGAFAERSMAKALHGENHRELIITVIALKRYRLKHGGYPEQLTDLLPEFLDAAPVDWMNGKELRYERVSPTEFRLWSVGTDGVDNGGDPLVPGSPKVMNPERGRDWVWPQVASPAAIDAFIKARETEMKKAVKKP